MSKRTSASLVAMVALCAAAPATRPTSGMRYRLEGDPDGWDPTARAAIVKAMDGATAVYQKMRVPIDMTVPVAYSPATPTADANYNGHVRFGGQISTRTALHELAHILGVGTYRSWPRFVVDGKWTGKYAQAQLRALDGPDAVLHADRQHFWPYGLNYDREGTTAEQFRRNVLMVLALRADMGLGPPPRLPATRP
jgi:hypothetical protein